MGDNSAFDKLSSTLTKYERLRLLERIGATDSRDIPFTETLKDAPPSFKAEDSYARLPWYKRLWYFIVGFFTGKSSLESFIDGQMAEIGRGIDITFPGMYDWQNGMLRQNFHSELTKLKEAARLFYSIFDSSINRGRGAFFVFLGSIEMRELYARLSKETEPAHFAAENPGISDTKLKQMAVKYLEKEIDDINESHRQIMYENAHTLVCLKQLSSFLFDRVIVSFSQTAGRSELVCPAATVKNQLVDINNILYSIKKSPSMTLLNAMFIFIMPEHDENDNYDMESELQKFTAKAEKAVEIIRTFYHRVPLVRILRCVLRDTSFVPTELAGGEEWFVLFRKCWIDNVTAQFNEFIKDRCRNRIRMLYDGLFEDFIAVPFENITADKNDEEKIPVDNIQSLSYLLTFHKLVFMPLINVFIRPILIDGDFIRKENRTEFTESYNILIKLDDTVKTYVKRLEKSGDLGKRWQQILSEIYSITVRHRKTAVILEDINHDVDVIVSDARKALVSMENILDGILDPSPGKPYDTLTNLAKISGKGTSFTDGLTDGLEKLRQMILLLSRVAELRNLEQ
ncbi:MAG: DUF5312 domain-containing protein [Spirochaetaceae bacterium]|jgi:uncharacterized protein Yka (UPF0111/DUF47 family)|nr:DUF5312 domain-containing protein [Spirochaetaceae bacterium]